MMENVSEALVPQVLQSPPEAVEVLVEEWGIRHVESHRVAVDAEFIEAIRWIAQAREIAQSEPSIPVGIVNLAAVQETAVARSYLTSANPSPASFLSFDRQKVPASS